ncbi:MAG: hypothetical protein LBH47_02510 [Christensenellaceae bacterium]|nr:hypothetical protein [Christensenellaceae bacterium]
MKKRKFVKALGIIITSLGLAGCFGNNQVFEGWTNSTNTIKYIITKQQDLDVLYEVAKWKDGEGDEIGFVEKGREEEGNKWTHYTRTNLYHSKPQDWEYDVTAEELRTMTKEQIAELRARENFSRGITTDPANGGFESKKKSTTTTTNKKTNSLEIELPTPQN